MHGDKVKHCQEEMKGSTFLDEPLKDLKPYFSFFTTK
jgi:hypothetical protein